jgi:hypothetical protein
MRAETTIPDVSVNTRDFSAVRLLTTGVTYSQRRFGQRTVMTKWDGHEAVKGKMNAKHSCVHLTLHQTLRKKYL